jgi:ATP-dependent RNA helicase RhlE
MVEREQKIGLLLHLLQNGNLSSVLIFSRTKHGADKINRKLERANIESVALHSDRTQNQRQRALDGFKNGQYRVMVATDIAARGIDVEGISHVINFDVPAIPEDYIHRIGRTGRAEATGDAITFVSSEEHKQLRQIERFIGREITPIELPGFTYFQIKVETPKVEPGMHRGRFSMRSKRRVRRRR